MKGLAVVLAAGGVLGLAAGALYGVGPAMAGAGMLCAAAVVWWVAGVIPTGLRAPSSSEMLSNMELASAMATRSTLAGSLRGKVSPVDLALVRATPTGQQWSSAPVYRVEVSGHLPGGGAVSSTALEPVPLPEVAKLVPGHRLRVLVDPACPDKIVVDW